MGEFIIDENKEQKDSGEDYGDISSSEEGFIKGYMEESDVEECEECGDALEPGKKVIRMIDDEEHFFCSDICANEYMESMN